MGEFEKAQGLRHRLESHLSELEHALSEAIIQKLSKVAQDAKDVAQQKAIDAQTPQNRTEKQVNPLAILNFFKQLGCLFIMHIVC